MQERHTDRKQYFEEQGVVTQKYVIPFIEEIIPITSDLVIAEIGCGEAGNVQPFVVMGCKVYGIDIAENKIANGKLFYQNHSNRDNLKLIASDIYKLDTSEVEKFDLVYM